MSSVLYSLNHKGGSLDMETVGTLFLTTVSLVIQKTICLVAIIPAQETLWLQ